MAGGLVLTLVDPPNGIIKYGLIFAIIAGGAYLDRWLLQPRPSRLKGANVVSMQNYQQSRNQRLGTHGHFRERRAFEQVFTTNLHDEIQELLELLRSDGLNPMMVSESRTNGESVYQLHLPTQELAKARPILKFFHVKTAKNHS